MGFRKKKKTNRTGTINLWPWNNNWIKIQLHPNSQLNTIDNNDACCSLC